MKPFIDFYARNGISPVHQDISDLEQHFSRRSALYHHLGIPPGAVRGKAVLEFGPGSGHNAIYTASLEPARYVLVDANPTGLAETRANLVRHAPATVEVTVEESLIEGFSSTGEFDLVLCEGVIPFQLDPSAFVRQVARHVRPGGLLVITCIDGVSFLGEAVRRLVADAIVPFAAPTAERLAVLRPVFAPHLATLAGMSRPVDDWIYDNILIPYTGSLFSIRDAIEALNGSFEVFGSSPRFLTDWRWYKQIYGENRRFNELGIAGYLAEVANLIDYRVSVPPQPSETGETLLRHAENLFGLMVAMEHANDTMRMPEAAGHLRAIGNLISPLSELTAESLAEAADFLESPGKPLPQFNRFESFFGRGQQYISFVRGS